MFFFTSQHRKLCVLKNSSHALVLIKMMRIQSHQLVDMFERRVTYTSAFTSYISRKNSFCQLIGNFPLASRELRNKTLIYCSLLIKAPTQQYYYSIQRHRAGARGEEKNKIVLFQRRCVWPACFCGEFGNFCRVHTIGKRWAGLEMKCCWSNECTHAFSFQSDTHGPNTAAAFLISAIMQHFLCAAST